MKPATLLEPTYYGNSKFEVQRQMPDNTAHRVATFDRLEDAKQYVHACNAYPMLVDSLKFLRDRLNARGEDHYVQFINETLGELGE